MDCDCSTCREACDFRSGWFLPEQLGLLAVHLHLSVWEVFRRHLAADWWVDPEAPNGKVLVVAPALVGSLPGEFYPEDPFGRCRFFQGGACAIHPVKPYECAEYMHTDTLSTGRDRHRAVADAWRPKQKMVRDLLGVDALLRERPQAQIEEQERVYDAIINSLCGRAEATVSDVAAAVGRNQRFVQRRLSELVNRGEVVRRNTRPARFRLVGARKDLEVGL